MEDAQKRRNMMLKNIPGPKKPVKDDDMKAAALVTSLETQSCPTWWLANTTGAYGNPIIAVFPRSLLKKETKRAAPEKEEEKED